MKLKLIPIVEFNLSPKKKSPIIGDSKQTLKIKAN